MAAAVRTPLRLTLALLIALTLSACGGGDSDAPATPAPTPWTTASPQATLPIVEVSYDGGVIRAELASTPAQRSKGLSGRASMDSDAGMLFDLGDTRVASFWMKDTLIPLDMVWIGEDRRVTGIAADVPVEPGVPAGELARWESGVPVRYVLELNAGEAARRGIDPGDELRW